MRSIDIFVIPAARKCRDMMIGMEPLVCMLVDCHPGQGQETWSTSLANMGGNNNILRYLDEIFS